MTDSEIIKALMCCGGEGDCESCPNKKRRWSQDGTGGCTGALMREALELIKRQKEEIGRLKENLEEAQMTIRKYQRKKRKITNEWIDASESLPENLDEVLVLIKDCADAFQWMIDDHMYGFGIAWYASDGWKMEGASYYCESLRHLQESDVCEYISHWQPLPEPPRMRKEKESEETK